MASPICLRCGLQHPPALPCGAFTELRADRVPHLLKRDVRYRQGSVEQHCGNCVMFHPPESPVTTGHCDLVIGPIAPHMVCDRWEAVKPASAE